MQYEFRPNEVERENPIYVNKTGKVYEYGEHPEFDEDIIIEVIDENGKKHDAFRGELFELEEDKETPEDVAERLYNYEMVNGYDISGYLQSSFLTGYKLAQEKSYSEIDMLKSFIAGIDCTLENGKNFEKFLKQLKQ